MPQEDSKFVYIKQNVELTPRDKKNLKRLPTLEDAINKVQDTDDDIVEALAAPQSKERIIQGRSFGIDIKEETKPPTQP